MTSEMSHREPHLWRLKRSRLRSRLVTNGWRIRGQYAEKAIAGRTVMVSAIFEQADWVVCRFERGASQ